MLIEIRYRLINGTDMTGGLNIENVGYIYENIPKSVFKTISYPFDGVPSPTMPGTKEIKERRERMKDERKERKLIVICRRIVCH